ncbi:MAG TPA: class D sortase [Candidatus Angelobacter sp.]|nr:class D sortase [Candidatus Angelobacter sp.]
MILLVAGSGILGYVASQYWYMYRTQRVLEHEWERQAAARSHVAADAPVLTRISIPKINLEAIVLEGASPEQLAAGPGHITDTALPGQAGNAVITGHRDTFFRRIFELETGDEVLIARGSLVFRYQVTGKKVVKPDDVSVLGPTSDAQLTLITCYPIHYIGPAPKRLVVSSRLVATDPSTSPASLLQ